MQLSLTYSDDIFQKSRFVDRDICHTIFNSDNKMRIFQENKFSEKLTSGCDTKERSFVKNIS